MIELVFPYPISANRYWISFYATKMKRVMTAPTKEATAYKREVKRIAREAGIIEPLTGRVKVGLLLYPFRPQDWIKRSRENPLNWDDDVRCIDLDNARKVVYDAMKNVVFEDDRFVFEDWGKRCEPDGNGRVVVVIEQLVQESPQPQLPLTPRQPLKAALEAKPF